MTVGPAEIDVQGDAAAVATKLAADKLKLTTVLDVFAKDANAKIGAATKHLDEQLNSIEV